MSTKETASSTQEALFDGGFYVLKEIQRNICFRVYDEINAMGEGKNMNDLYALCYDRYHGNGPDSLGMAEKFMKGLEMFQGIYDDVVDGLHRRYRHSPIQISIVYKNPSPSIFHFFLCLVIIFIVIQFEFKITHNTLTFMQIHRNLIKLDKALVIPPSGMSTNGSQYSSSMIGHNVVTPCGKWKLERQVCLPAVMRDSAMLDMSGVHTSNAPGETR